MVRVSLTKKPTLAQRLVAVEGKVIEALWGKESQAEGTKKCKGSEERGHGMFTAVCWSSLRDASEKKRREERTGYIHCGAPCGMKMWSSLFKIIKNFKIAVAQT